jgi:hypothetical protein
VFGRFQSLTVDTRRSWRIAGGGKVMSIQPEGENIRKATKWISEARTDNPDEKLSDLIEKACVKFDLSPSDCEFLTRFFSQKTGQ